MQFRGDAPEERFEEQDPRGNGGVRTTHPGNEDEPSLKEVRIAPDTLVEAHAHDTDEIIYVLDGELHLGARVLTAGSSVLIPGRTLYAFRSGPDGLGFLNFRPRRDRTHYSKEALRALPRAAKD